MGTHEDTIHEPEVHTFNENVSQAFEIRQADLFLLLVCFGRLILNYRSI